MTDRWFLILMIGNELLYYINLRLHRNWNGWRCNLDRSRSSMTIWNLHKPFAQGKRAVYEIWKRKWIPFHWYPKQLLLICYCFLGVYQKPTQIDEKYLLLCHASQNILQIVAPIISMLVVLAFNAGGYWAWMCGDGTNDVGFQTWHMSVVRETKPDWHIPKPTTNMNMAQQETQWPMTNHTHIKEKWE